MPQTPPRRTRILDWLADEALLTRSMEELFEACCQRLVAAGFPLLRGFTAFRILHPLYEAKALNWTAAGIAEELFPTGNANSDTWFQSPVYHVVSRGQGLLRRRLSGPRPRLDFPVLEEFKAMGGTDYVCCLVAFDPGTESGVVSSWLGGGRGFTPAQVAFLRRVSRQLAIALKPRIERAIAETLATAYLGEAAGRAVLQGSIKRGDGERLQGVLWYADLRRSTALAERLPAEAFLERLNAFFEMTAGAVSDAGGEVVTLIGDAVLAFFRPDPDPAEACRRAVAAAAESRQRLAARDDPDPLAFGIALHYGSVVHGNIGVPHRLQFTIVGKAVNEAVRVQELTKELGRPVLATEPLRALLGETWPSLGRHALRGLEAPVELYDPLSPAS